MIRQHQAARSIQPTTTCCACRPRARPSFLSFPTRPRTARTAVRVSLPPFFPLSLGRRSALRAPCRAGPSPPLQTQLPPSSVTSRSPTAGGPVQLVRLTCCAPRELAPSLAVMRWRGGTALLFLLLLAVFFAVAVAEDTLPADKNNVDSPNRHSDVGKLGRPDETNPEREVVHDDRGSSLKNDTAGNNNKDNSTEGTSGSRDEPMQQLNNKGDKATESSQAKDFLQDPLIMECDPSHRCVIEKNKFIACLKVPGEDSLALSLLMDNKGMHPLDVSITAPDYVTLAEETVHVEANNHNETQVSVSISDDAANNTAIVLKVAEETCTINIHSAIARETAGPAMRMRLTSTYTLVPVFILLAVVGACVKLRARRQDGGGLVAYQKLDTTELPVSVGGKKEPYRSDKWDDNWGDDWDDEEAPLTPSKPKPNSSSVARLAARRSMKDGWKD